MMMRMIVAGGVPPLVDGVRPPDVDNPLGYFEYEPVKRTREDPTWLGLAGGHVVKMVHVLLRDLPAGYPYAVVMMHRDPGEVVSSQQKMLARLGRAGGSAADDALQRVFAAQLAEVERHVAARAEFRTLDVHYARVLGDPAAQAGRVAAFLGLDTAPLMAAAVDATLYRNRAAPRG